MTSPSQPTAADEVVDLCGDLIRFDTSNPTSNERAAAEYVAAKLAEVGLDPTVVESEPGRTSVVARIAGSDPGRGALLVHGHLDVVPANATDWTVHPFSGEIRDGYLWGRGAVDMKDMDAMTLAVVRQWMREGRRPPRDVVVAFVADEEAGGELGASWLVDHHPELFDGCTEAISEVGGFSVTVDGRRFYLIQAAEKGLAWLRLRASGRAGHGSMISEDNAVTYLCQAITRLGEHRFPVRPTKTVEAFLSAVGGVLGRELDPHDPDQIAATLGPVSRMIGASLRNTVNPTMLGAGYKCNVIPGSAEGAVDGRYLPGQEEDFLAAVDELLGPAVDREWIVRAPAVETDYSGPVVEAMEAALRAEDPDGHPVPYLLSAGTDGKHFSRLGIRCFGFTPLLLPADLDFSALFHGVDERVPVEALRFGTRVLDRFLSLS